VTGVLVGHGRILLCQQHVTESSTRRWSLPGGTLEFRESIEKACPDRSVARADTGARVTDPARRHWPGLGDRL